MSNKSKKIAKAALQYSKWMSKFICWVWALYRFAALFLATAQPVAAEALASTLYQLDWIMLVNMGTYLVNSLGEKYIYSDRFIFKWLETGGFKEVMSRVGTLALKQKKEFQDDVNDAIEEEETLEDEQEATEDGGDNSCG